MSEEIRLCKNCKLYTEQYNSFHNICWFDYKLYIDYVNGKRADPIQCQKARNNPKLCGSSAKHFEPK